MLVGNYCQGQVKVSPLFDRKSLPLNPPIPHSPFVKGCVRGNIESTRHHEKEKNFDEVTKGGFQNRTNETHEDEGRDQGDNAAKLLVHEKFAAI